MSQAELDLEKMSPQVLIDDINKKREIIETFVNVAIEAHNKIFAEMQTLSPENQTQIKAGLSVLKSGITAAVADTNATVDNLLKYRKNNG